MLFHNKLYNNQFHNISLFYEPLKSYMEKIPANKFPHHIFTYNKKVNSNDSASSPNAVVANRNILNNKNNFINNAANKNNPINENKNSNENLINKNNNNETKNKIGNFGTGHYINEKRASQIKFNHLKIEAKSKNNLACKLASLALNLAATNKQRHEAIQNFFLINDSTTIATEVPIYLTNWDAGYYRNEKGFIFPLNNYKTPITGHIDILQIRNGLIHILDYKPEANKIQPIE